MSRPDFVTLFSVKIVLDQIFYDKKFHLEGKKLFVIEKYNIVYERMVSRNDHPSIKPFCKAIFRDSAMLIVL